MLERAELGHRVGKRAYEAALPKLRSDLLAAHFELRDEKFPVIVIVSGADGAGKGELVHRLNEWLDPRGVETHAFWRASAEETERPPYWRFWRAMPGRGRIGIFFGSWYSDPIVRRVYGETRGRQLAASLDRIVAFERMLVDDGALLVKLWMHLPRSAQRRALEKLERSGRITPTDWKHFDLYDRFRRVSEQALARTHDPRAPWHPIDATDRRHRELEVGRILLRSLRARIDARDAKPRKVPVPAARAGSRGALDRVDLARKLAASEYAAALGKHQERLSRLAWKAWHRRRSMVIVFEGWDAAGKGSAIRRVTQALDPRLYRVVGVAAPTDEELAHHYLWRFWRHVPRAGRAVIFDRSWYGRVLVERVEGFASPAAWGRAYGEINDFEAQLAEGGVIVVKLWIHLSPEEQLRRFEERKRIAYKRYKITDEDWRNREKWKPYESAVEDMIARTSTEHAPWTIVAGDDKRFARVQIVKTIVKGLQRAL
ncbi:MAG: polyphosphate:AMP phosphotransferase [Acidobacteriota bacterium]